MTNTPANLPLTIRLRIGLMVCLTALVAVAGCSSSDPASELAARCANRGVLTEQLASVNSPAAAAELLTGVAGLAQCTGEAAVQVNALAVEATRVIQGKGLLDAALGLMITQANSIGGALGVEPEKVQTGVREASNIINAELCARGQLPTCQGNIYTSWDDLATQHMAAVRAATATVGTPEFKNQIGTLSGAAWVGGNRLSLLVDGPASFAARDQLIQGATRSIWLLSWAVVDDETGQDTVRLLTERFKNDGIDVRVIVDGNVAERPGYDGTRALRDANVPVKLWKDPSRPGHGVHMKALIVDGQVMVTGGMNIGNGYSHRGPADKPKWRDTDVKVEGPAVAQAAQVFASLWGDGLVAPSPNDIASVGSVEASFTAQLPTGPARIQLATLKAIESARQTIDIENAYFIKTPDLETALQAALARGVKVRIFTNSAESIDEPTVMQPVLESMPSLLAAGAEIYLRRGSTLHSKFLVVDRQYAWVGSFNLHPRSVRYEGEDVLQVLDAGFAETLAAQFETDLAQATRVRTVADLNIPSSAVGTLVTRFFFDQL